jgi:hypothetical protein
MSVGQTSLSTSIPLLSNLPHHESDERDAYYYDEDEGCMTCCLQIVVSSEDLDEVSVLDDSGQPPSWWNGNVVTCWCWVVLPALLFLQFLPALLFLQFKFGTGLCMSGTEATLMIGLCWSGLSYVIVLFVVVATLYHQAIKDCKSVTCTVVILAPGMLLNIILGLAILDQLAAAFVFMLGSILFLGIVVAAIRIRGLIASTNSGSTEEDDCSPQPRLQP